MTYQEKFSFWCKNATDITVKNQLAEMQNDEEKIKNSFYKDLEFGTAGLRGTMGAGSNCLNVYTIIKTTQGVCDFLKSQQKSSAAVTFDSRLNSQLFAETAARVFAKNNIKCHLTKSCQPTPFLSYIVRQLHCDVGVNITASHNPKEYNGYKVYDENGCQLTDECAALVSQFVDKVNPFTIKLLELETYLAENLIVYTSRELLESYINRVLQENLNCASSVKVAFSPLNGAGHSLVPQILRNVGVKDIFVVEEQSMPNGNFSTCTYPNPEKKETLFLALELAKKHNCDLVIATDPDCDRLGVAVKHHNDFVVLTGNEIGVLLVYYILTSLSERRQINKDSIVVKTIVTSALVEKVCNSFAVSVVDVLTGFKYIGNVIKNLEDQDKKDLFIFGFEESCGYLKGTYVRDKDAVVASMLVAEMTATFKMQNLTLVDVLQNLYNQFGTYEHTTVSYSFPGAEGEAKKLALLNKIRKEGFSEIGGQKVVEFVDYLDNKKTNLPKSDVLKFVTDKGTSVIIRPSGTEPLIKNYITVCDTPEKNKQLKNDIFRQLESIYN